MANDVPRHSTAGADRAGTIIAGRQKLAAQVVEAWYGEHYDANGALMPSPAAAMANIITVLRRVEQEPQAHLAEELNRLVHDRTARAMRLSRASGKAAQSLLDRGAIPPDQPSSFARLSGRDRLPLLELLANPMVLEQVLADIGQIGRQLARGAQEVLAQEGATMRDLTPDQHRGMTIQDNLNIIRFALGLTVQRGETWEERLHSARHAPLPRSQITWPGTETGQDAG
jgi:hypothetical protein